MCDWSRLQRNREERVILKQVKKCKQLIVSLSVDQLIRED